MNVSDDEREELKNQFKTLGFSALNFTDSRSVYQFYNLVRLWDDIQTALKAGITLWHPATEPVSAGEIYKYLTGEEFVNELNGVPADYGYKTVYADVFHGSGCYVESKESILKSIYYFVEECEK